MRTPVALDDDALAQAFLDQQKASVFGILARQGFDLGARQSLSYQLFATENPSVLFLEFTMTYGCADIRGEGRTEAVLSLKGDGSYMPAAATFTALRNGGEHIRYRMPDGTERENQNHVLVVAGMVIGHREESNTVRYRIDQER